MALLHWSKLNFFNEENIITTKPDETTTAIHEVSDSKQEMNEDELLRELILCKIHGDKQDLPSLLEKAGLYYSLLEYYIDVGNTTKVIETCESYGPLDSTLYLSAIKYLSTKDDKQVDRMLTIIGRKDLNMINFLLDQETLSLGSVRDFLVDVLSLLTKTTSTQNNEIENYKNVTRRIRQKMENLNIFKQITCSACHNDLYTSDNEECPICTEENQKLIDEIGIHETSSLIDTIQPKQLDNNPEEYIAKLLAELV